MVATLIGGSLSGSVDDGWGMSVEQRPLELSAALELRVAA